MVKKLLYDHDENFKNISYFGWETWVNFYIVDMTEEKGYDYGKKISEFVNNLFAFILLDLLINFLQLNLLFKNLQFERQWDFGAEKHFYYQLIKADDKIIRKAIEYET